MPTAEQLEFRNKAAESVVGLDILMNWAGVGWMAGKITEANRDGRKKVNGVAGNFIVHYTLDETDGTHVLAQDTYGPGKDHGSWVLLLVKV